MVDGDEIYFSIAMGLPEKEIQRIIVENQNLKAEITELKKSIENIQNQVKNDNEYR